MAFKETMKQLEADGTMQNRKVYTRHGVGENMFGVSYANLKKLAKQIKTDHELAIQLWETGNHDARVLATMIADPEKADNQLLESWAQDLDNYVITDAFANFASQTALAKKKLEKWSKSPKEWIGRSGWLLLAQLLKNNGDFSDGDLQNYLNTIENEIHHRKNRVKDAMNSALIALGIYCEDMREKALAASRKIGKVEVDHGQTGCKTPDAESYIKKSLERKK
jgi:3-methyladenine DNA glycosylase AlkD